MTPGLVEIDTDGGEGLLLCDGLESAFVGVVTRLGGATVACYSLALIVAHYAATEGMTADEAEEFFWRQVIGDGAGERTPVLVRAA